MNDDINTIWHEETTLERFKIKAKESPFMIIGIMGMIGACGYGAYSYRYRGNMKTSIFLMRLRVIAQGAVIGSLTCGLLYTIINDNVLHKKSN